MSTPRRQAAERAFLSWLAEPDSADELPIDADDETELPLTQLLGELSLSRRFLPAEAATVLGLPHGTSIGHAATELLLAVNDPGGPRCRSYRAAIFFLRGGDRFPSVRGNGGRTW